MDYLSVQTNKPYTIYLTNIGMVLPEIYGWLIFFSMGVVFENSFANFFMSLNTGRVPKDWNTAFVCPLFKKGDTSLALDWPQSLMSIF